MKYKGLLIILFISQCLTMYGQTSFEKGYQKGYNEGYCYRQSITCIAPLLFTTPIPRIGESSDSYNDGYNRGFQVGLDLQRISNSTSSNQPYYRTIPNYRSSEYVPPVDLKLLTNVLAYKQKLFDLRANWVQQKIFDLNDLNFSLLSNSHPTEYSSITNSINSFVNTQLNGQSIDYSDNNVFNQIQGAFKNFERDIAYAVNKPANTSNIVIPLYDAMNTGSNAGKVRIKLKGINQYSCISTDGNGIMIENDLNVYAIKLAYSTMVFAYSKSSNSIYTYNLDDDSYSGSPKTNEMELLGKSSTSLFYGKNVKPIIHDKGTKQDNLVSRGEQVYKTTNGQSYSFKVYENPLTNKRYYILAFGYDESLPDYQLQVIYAK